VTTENFRDGMSKQEWVDKRLPVLRDIEYERLEGEARGVRVEGDTALVTFNATIDTVVGKCWQKELYSLVRRGQIWLLDDMEVVEEDPEPQREEL
jgi:hypothetical protein